MIALLCVLITLISHYGMWHCSTMMDPLNRPGLYRSLQGMGALFGLFIGLTLSPIVFLPYIAIKYQIWPQVIIGLVVGTLLRIILSKLILIDRAKSSSVFPYPVIFVFDSAATPVFALIGTVSASIIIQHFLRLSSHAA